MRKSAIVIPALLVTIMINAQFKKGDKMVGASVGSVFYNNSSADLSNSLGSATTGTDHFGVAISPSIGWFINESVAIGIAPSISYDKQKQIGKSSNGNTYLKDESNHFGVNVGGFARYYFRGASDKLRFFGQYNLSLGLGGGKNEGFEYERNGLYVERYERKSSGDFMANTGITAGLSKFLGRYTALDVYIGYNFSYTKSSPAGTTITDYTDPGTPDTTVKIDYEQKITGHNIVLGVGFQVFLEKRK